MKHLKKLAAPLLLAVVMTMAMSNNEVGYL